MPGGSHLKKPNLAEEAAWLAAAALAARTYSVRVAEVIDCRGRETRGPPAIQKARRAAVYLAVVGANLSTRGLSRASGLACNTIRPHLHALEDDRETRAALDAQMEELTQRLQGALTRMIAGGPAAVPPTLGRAA
jgi:hypothetical protein